MTTRETLIWTILLLLGAIGVAAVASGCIPITPGSTGSGSTPTGGHLSSAVSVGLSFLSWASIAAVALGIFEFVSAIVQGTSTKGGIVIAAAGVICLVASELLATYLRAIEIGCGVLLLAALIFYAYDCWRDRKLIIPQFVLGSSSSSSGGAVA